MTRTNLIVGLLRMIFGVIAAIAILLLLVGVFIFDDSAAYRNPLAWNLALAPAMYIALYAWSSDIAAIFFSSPSAERSQTIQMLLPALGILWYGVAWLLLVVFCGGRFGCAAS